MNIPYKSLLNTKIDKSVRDEWALQVYNSLWGTQEGIITKMEGVDVLHSCLTPLHQEFPVIVREEYRLIWEHAAKTLAAPRHNGHGGLVVYGQPGIGKSLFLRYALAQCIKAKIPVAWCADALAFYFFDEKGVWICNYIEAPHGCRLALFDTVPGMEAPSSSFYGPDQGVFVVQATSQVSRWKGWSKQTDAELWVMNIWNAKEIDSMRKLKQTKYEYHDPVSVSTYLGPSARHCARDWKKSGDPTVDFKSWGPPSFDNSDVLYDTLKRSKFGFSEERPHFHKYFFITPNPGQEWPVSASMDLPVKLILPTDFLRNRMLDTYCSQSVQELKDMRRKFSPFPQICGAMFEVFAVKRLWLFQEPMNCHFLTCAPLDLPGGINQQTLFPADTAANTLWIPLVGYPTVDAVMVTLRNGKKCITFLQMTIAKQHDIKPQGIARIWQNFDWKALHDIEWRFVFVVPTEEIGKRLCKQKPSHSQAPRRNWRPMPLNPQELKRKCLAPLEDIVIPVGYSIVKCATEEQRQEWAKEFLWGEGKMEDNDDDPKLEYELVVIDEQE